MMCVEQILSFVWEIQFTNSSLFRRMALAMKGAQLVKQANFAPAAIQHFNYSSEVRMHRYSEDMSPTTINFLTISLS